MNLVERLYTHTLEEKVNHLNHMVKLQQEKLDDVMDIALKLSEENERLRGEIEKLIRRYTPYVPTGATAIRKV